MRTVLPALVFAAFVAAPAAAQPVLAPGPFVHSPGGTYVQYYDPRTGVPVGGPVAVAPEEFAARAAAVPPDAPVIRVRPAPGAEPVYAPRPVVGPRVYGPRYGDGVYGPRVYGPRYGVYGPRRYGPRVYGPRYGVYGPRYRAGIYAPGVRYGAPIYAGPRRLAPAPFRYGRAVPGYRVVPARGVVGRPGVRPHGPYRPGMQRPVGPAHRVGAPPARHAGAPRPPVRP